MRVLLTGATGFVGGALLSELSEIPTVNLRIALRRARANLPEQIDHVVVGELSADNSWSHALESVDVVIHCASRVHVMDETLNDPLPAYREANVKGTLNLARQAASAGVKRFIFISSIKVNGEMTLKNTPFKADDIPNPADPYGVSKMEAELGLQRLIQTTEMDVVIIRPVLIYGPGVKANFHSMIRLLDRGVPLPFGAIENRRSLVAIENLVSLVTICLDHPAAANQVFLVSDGEDISTSALMRKVSSALGKKARLFPVPVWILNIGLVMIGRGAMAQRLCGSLQVDIAKTCSMLGWRPRVKIETALQGTIHRYLDNKDNE